MLDVVFIVIGTIFLGICALYARADSHDDRRIAIRDRRSRCSEY